MSPADSMRMAEEAEAELLAELAIVRILKPLGQERRKHVMEALQYLLEADRCVPGVLRRFLEGGGK